MSKKQRIVAVTAAVYMAVLGILTICSDVIMKMNLPQITYSESTSGYVSGKWYETIVPNSCIFDADTGCVIYELVEKETPLGIRYYVNQRRVEIKAEDEHSTAIIPHLEDKTRLVNSSTKELSDAVQVMLTQ